MIRWARRQEALSDDFVLFCRRHALHDRHANRNRYWEYPWAYFRSGVRPGDAVLDAGAGYSSFLTNLRFAGITGELHVSDPSFATQAPPQFPGISIRSDPLESLTYADGAFDVIFCLSVIEHLPAALHARGVRELARCLKPGGRLVLTVDYFLQWPLWVEQRAQRPKWYAWLPGETNVDIVELIDASGLELAHPDLVDAFPLTPEGEQSAIDSGDLWYSEHVRPSLKVTSVGVVLRRPWTTAALCSGRFNVSGEALHRLQSGEFALVRHLGAHHDTCTARAEIPASLVGPGGFSVRELALALGCSDEVACGTLQEWLRHSMARPLEDTRAPREVGFQTEAVRARYT